MIDSMIVYKKKFIIVISLDTKYIKIPNNYNNIITAHHYGIKERINHRSANLLAGTSQGAKIQMLVCLWVLEPTGSNKYGAKAVN